MAFTKKVILLLLKLENCILSQRNYILNYRPLILLYLVLNKYVSLSYITSNYEDVRPTKYSLSQSKSEGKRFETTLRDIDAIQIDKSNSNGGSVFCRLVLNLEENCFTLQLQGNRKWLIKADSKREMAEWIIAIDGLLSNIGSNSFNTFIQPETDKVKRC